MNKEAWKELFTRYKANPILMPQQWPYRVAAVYNPGATRFRGEVLLLVRVEDRRGYSHLGVARSENGKTGWKIASAPALIADSQYGEAEFGLEDPRITFLEDLQEYIVACTSFALGVPGEPAAISLISTKDFSRFERLSRPMIPPNKNGALFSKSFNGKYALIHRPLIEGRGDIWVSFSPDLRYWGEHQILFRGRHRGWDADRIGIGPSPIETPEGWLIIYHGSRETASGNIYRIGLSLLDLDTLRLMRWSKDWVLGPEKPYERTGNVDEIIFPCGAVVDEKTNELVIYYGAADSVVGLATAKLNEVVDYLKRCPSE